MIEVMILASGYLTLFISIELIARWKIVDHEITRKVAHISAGTTAAFLPLIISFKQIMLLSGLFAAVMLLSKYKKIFQSIHQVGRKTHGEVYFAVAIFLTALIFPNDSAYTLGVLIMSLSDGFASIVGQKFGKKVYTLWQGQKSYVGSAVFLIVTMVLTLFFTKEAILVIIIATSLTITEAALSGGVDNLVLPPLAAGLYVGLMRLVGTR